nr:MAG TPA: hypothetical protein [Caudoviricetes sp.]
MSLKKFFRFYCGKSSLYYKLLKEKTPELLDDKHMQI